jgi:hypothetical protein
MGTNQLLASVPSSLIGKVEFYSAGSQTLMGPKGWTCSELQAADGGIGMSVYPPGQANPTIDDHPTPPGGQGVFATFEYTGHTPGLDVVCPISRFPPLCPSDAQPLLRLGRRLRS